MSLKDIDLEEIFQKARGFKRPYDQVFKDFFLDFGEALIDEVHKELEEIKKELKEDDRRLSRL